MALDDFHLDESRWDAMQIPIGLAFFFYSSASESIVTIYPSPAGPTEAPLPAQAWARVVADNPVLGRMQPDTQALLVKRMHSDEEACYFLAPIDQCYRLVGEIRRIGKASAAGSVRGRRSILSLRRCASGRAR